MDQPEEFYGQKTLVLSNGQEKSTPNRIDIEQPENHEDSGAKPGVPRKPITAYFLFMAEQRKETNLSNKEISAVWNSMSASDKQVYIQKSSDMKVAYDRYKAEVKQRDQENGIPSQEQDKDEIVGLDLDIEANGADHNPNDLMNSLLPISRLKNLLKLDRESSDNIRLEAVKYIQEAGYNFAKELIAQSILQARKQKKKKLLPEHILRAADVEARFNFLLDSNIWGEEIEKIKRDSSNTPRKSREVPENTGNLAGNKKPRVNTFKSPNKVGLTDGPSHFTGNLSEHFAMMAQRNQFEPVHQGQRMIPERTVQASSKEPVASKPKPTELTSFFQKKS